MKRSDVLKQYVALHQLLRKEKAELEARLAQINRALGNGHAATRNGMQIMASMARPARGARRLRNPISLPKAVIRLTSRRPMTKREILSEVTKLGYRFTAKDPMNSLNTVLYGRNPKFKNEGGKFSAMVAAPGAAKSTGAGKPRRAMSSPRPSKPAELA